MCGRCKNEYRVGCGQYRTCPRPQVIAKYGKRICVECCRKCKFVEVEKYGTFRAYGCGYNKNKEENQ